MSERGIIFSGVSVRAIFAGQKTETRRPVKEPEAARLHGRSTRHARSFADRGGYLHWAYGGGDLGDDVLMERVFCPYAEATGDRLWVRETVAPGYLGGGRAAYKADWDFEAARTRHAGVPVVSSPKWTSSRFMRRTDCRLELIVVSVRVERLHDIDEAGAIAEGLDPQMSSARSQFVRGWNAFRRAPLAERTGAA